MSILERDLIKEREAFWRGKEILVTGGAGFLGRNLTSRLQELGASQIETPRSRDNDLRVYEHCLRICKGKDLVIHMAGDVGGIGYNREHPYRLAHNNLVMAANIINAAIECNVQRFVGIGTICEYPKFTPVPFREEDLWSGYPEETNAPYGLAKKMLLVLSQAARQEFGFNAIHVLPVNLFGPGDNFNPESSHVIPALIRKFVQARINNEPSVQVWGTGRATREFLYVEDAAEGICLATEGYNSPEPVNIGAGREISIKYLAETIQKLVDYKGSIVWDASKPDGQPRRMLDTSRAEREFGFRATTSFEDGLRKTILWYLENS